ncbi:hypothetical protein D3C75_1317610 [compost metagenome]
MLEGNAQHLLEQVGEIALAEVGLPRYLLQRQAGVQIGANISFGLMNDPGGFGRAVLFNPAAAFPA